MAYINWKARMEEIVDLLRDIAPEALPIGILMDHVGPGCEPHLRKKLSALVEAGILETTRQQRLNLSEQPIGAPCTHWRAV